MWFSKVMFVGHRIVPRWNTIPVVMETLLASVAGRNTLAAASDSAVRMLRFASSLMVMSAIRKTFPILQVLSNDTLNSNVISPVNV